MAVVADGRNAEPADFTLEAIAALAALRAQVGIAEDRSITDRYPQHFGARVNGYEVRDATGDPERPLSEAGLRDKMAMLGRWGGLSDSEISTACHLALETDDAAGIDAMIEKWLA